MSDELTRGQETPARERVRDALDRIDAALRGLRYGTVTAVVQDGVVVQVERTEKFRIAGDSRSRARAPEQVRRSPRPEQADPT